MNCKCKSCGKTFDFNKIMKTSYNTVERDIRSQGQDYGEYVETHQLYICPFCGSSNTNYADLLAKKAEAKKQAEANKVTRYKNNKALHSGLGKTLTLGSLIDYLDNSSVRGFDYNSVKFTVNGKEMITGDIAALFKKGAVINLTCDSDALEASEKAYFNKFTKEELIGRMFGVKAYTNWMGRRSLHLVGQYKEMLAHPKDYIINVFKQWQKHEITVDDAYNKMCAI